MNVLRWTLGVVTLTGLMTLFVTAKETAKVDAPAPGFVLTDTEGKSHSLGNFRGKYVILEWVNFDCPFVHKHYGSGAMQELQRSMTAKGIIWLSICSSAPGRQGYFEGNELKERIQKEKASPTAYLVDADGIVGRLYEAKTTPHMFVIDPKGTLIYAGGIDNIASTNREDIGKATNFVKEAIDEALQGKPVSVKNTRSYGCSVKYK